MRRTDAARDTRVAGRAADLRRIRSRGIARLLGAACLASALAVPAAAQIAWDTPRMIGPESPTGLGIYWLRAESLPGDDDAVMGSWTLPATDGRVSVRGGFGTGVADEEAAFGGIDIRAPLARHTDTQPLDLGWSAGAGVGVGEYVLISVPLAVSAGRSWSSGAVWFAPYLWAGAAADYRIGDGDVVPDEEFDVQVTAGVGADVAFDEARRVVVRAVAAMGERQAIVVGLVVGGGR